MMRNRNSMAKRLLTLVLALVLVFAVSACNETTETPETPEIPEVKPATSVADPAAVTEQSVEGSTSTVVRFTGAEEAKVKDEVMYTISIEKVSGFATATFYLELDAGVVEEPIVEGLNGFMVLSVNFEEVDGKWVGETVMMNLAGLTTEEPADVAAVYAKTVKSGSVTATLTDATLSAYVGEDSEDWVEYTFDGNSVTTEIH